MKEFAICGYISNLKINYSKSEALNISLPEPKLKTVQDNSSFKWESQAIKYLGVWLTPRLSSIFTISFPFSNQLKEICKLGESSFCGLAGRPSAK